MEKLAISSVQLDPANARKHNEKNMAAIKGSLARFGQQKPIVIDKNNVVIAGNGTLAAAKALGWTEIGVVRTQLEGPEAIAFALADNRTAELAEWDLDVVSKTIQSLKDFDIDVGSFGFDDKFIESVTPKAVGTKGLTDPDEIPEVKDTRCKPGDLWILGKHRLLCGDSTNVQHVERLMGGEKADMVFTDPPYNTGMSTKDDSTWLSHMFNDSFTDEEWQALLSGFVASLLIATRDDSVLYVCLDWRRSHELVPHLKRAFKFSNLIVWDKIVHGLGSDYKYTHEFIHVCKRGKPDIETHQGDREYQDVWRIQRKMGRDTELVDRALRHASKPNGLVVDIFLGSGSTLIACEKTGRRCFGMEIDPHYCDVILTRWEKFTGQSARLFGENIG